MNTTTVSNDQIRGIHSDKHLGHHKYPQHQMNTTTVSDARREEKTKTNKHTCEFFFFSQTSRTAGFFVIINIYRLISD